MSFDLNRLYNLLPALYRIRDTKLGLKMLTVQEKQDIEASAQSLDDHAYGPIKSLLSIIAEQVAVLEENLAQLYDDQFIETCAEWAVSYIGELVGTQGLIEIPGASFSQRAEVANTISYRRRKGTASVIEQLARDVTNWNANVVEYFERLATTQYLNHLRPGNLSMSSLRNEEALLYKGSPFDQLAHTVEVRRITPKRGKYNIQNIGVFLWRLDSYSLSQVPAHRVDDRRYTFDPLGQDRQLYNLPITETQITHLAEPTNVPMPISRRQVWYQLETYYGKGKSMLLSVDGQEVLPTTENTNLQDLISICDLSDLLDPGGNLIDWANMPQEKIAIDPTLGRIAFPANALPTESVHVNFHYGFSAQIGGGEYDRAFTFAETQDPIIEIISGTTSIQDALDQLSTSGGVVEILDNENYFEDLNIQVPEGKTIELRSADKKRPVLVLNGEINIAGAANSQVILNGLLISGGRIHVPQTATSGEDNKLESLLIQHCTLVPGDSPAWDEIPARPKAPRIVVEQANVRLTVERSITGSLRIFDGAKVFIKDSIVDATDESLVAYAGLTDEEAGGILHIQNSTLIGKIHTLMMDLASNTIFMADGPVDEFWPAPIMAQRLQQGCVRFSYFPPGSKLPRPYRCQPTRAEIAASVRPQFTSLHYGDPGYGQLSKHCAIEITQGADDEAEMGVFHHLYQPQRLSNLQTRLDEYLRFGLEAGVFFAS